MAQVLANSPAGPIESLNLKSRQRRRYWKPIKDKDGNMTGWEQTGLLPADAQSKEGYLNKGFRLSPPGADSPPDNGEKKALLDENERLRAELEALKLAKTPAPLYVSDKKK